MRKTIFYYSYKFLEYALQVCLVLTSHCPSLVYFHKIKSFKLCLFVKCNLKLIIHYCFIGLKFSFYYITFIKILMYKETIKA